MRRCSKSGITYGPADGCADLVVAVLEVVTGAGAERAGGISSSDGGVWAKSIVPKVLGRSGIRINSS